MAPNDPRRPDHVFRYQKDAQSVGGSMTEYINALGMVCSLVGLLMKVSIYSYRSSVLLIRTSARVVSLYFNYCLEM